MSDPRHPEYERHADGWHEWSTDTSDRRDDGVLLGKPKRLFVRCGDDLAGLIEIVEADVTSDKPEGRQLEGTPDVWLNLTGELADWLIERLQKARATNAEEEKLAASPTGAPQ